LALYVAHGQSPRYLHEIPSYAKASEGYPPTAKSAEALMPSVRERFSDVLRIHPRAEPVPARRSVLAFLHAGVVFCAGG